MNVEYFLIRKRQILSLASPLFTTLICLTYPLLFLLLVLNSSFHCSPAYSPPSFFFHLILCLFFYQFSVFLSSYQSLPLASPPPVLGHSFSHFLFLSFTLYVIHSFPFSFFLSLLSRIQSISLWFSLFLFSPIPPTLLPTSFSFLLLLLNRLPGCSE